MVEVVCATMYSDSTDHRDPERRVFVLLSDGRTGIGKTYDTAMIDTGYDRASPVERISALLLHAVRLRNLGSREKALDVMEVASRLAEEEAVAVAETEPWVGDCLAGAPYRHG